MDLVGALNRVFEKVLGVKTADSKKLLDDYIGGGGGDGGILHVNVSATNTEQGTKYTLDKKAGELIEALDAGKFVIADLANAEIRTLLFCSGYFNSLGEVYLISFFDAQRRIAPEGSLSFSAEGLDEYPSFESGGK